MKKLFLMLFAVAFTASASAQTVEESKTWDNVYIGVNGGLATKTTGHAWMKGLNPNLGLRVGRYFTPVFGLALESNVYFSNKPGESVGTFVRTMNTSLLGTVNLSNWFGGYKGEPRLFEVSALYGIGWGHVFGHPSEYTHDNMFTSKAAVDFAFNLGKAKAWQIYIEPAMIWTLAGNNLLPDKEVQYDVNESGFQLNVGFIYKFKNSNGTHNFKVAELRDQSEIDALNAKINDLRSDLNGKDEQLAAKNRQIADLQKALDDLRKTNIHLFNWKEIKSLWKDSHSK